MKKLLALMFALALLIPAFTTSAQETTPSQISSVSGRWTITYPAEWVASNAVQTDVQRLFASESLTVAENPDVLSRVNVGPNIGGSHMIFALFPTLQVYPLNPNPQDFEEVITFVLSGLAPDAERLTLSGLEAVSVVQPGGIRFTMINLGSAIMAISSQSDSPEDEAAIDAIIDSIQYEAVPTAETLTQPITTADGRLTFNTGAGWYFGAQGSVAYTAPDPAAIQDVSFGLMGSGAVQSPVLAVLPRSYAEFFEAGHTITPQDLQTVLDLTLSEFESTPADNISTGEWAGYPAAWTDFVVGVGANIGRAYALDAGHTIYVVMAILPSEASESLSPLLDSFFASVSIAPLPPEIAALPPEGLREGYRAPGFESRYLDNSPVALSDLRGQVVMLNFWFTTCPPCQIEMPIMEAMYQEYREQGFTILAINNRETPTPIVSFMDTLGLTFPVVLDTVGFIQQQYGIVNYPTSIFIDREGIIYAVHYGPITEEDIRGYITSALAAE